eukprot:Skav220140  [mRNA]  locus=scaffold1320:179617:182382:+ [translate_table: standard]
MEVFSKVSGEVLASFEAEEVRDRAAKEVKRLLAPRVGVSRFRQRFFLENALEDISDDEILFPGTTKVWLVRLGFERTVGELDEQMIRACENNDTEVLERLLQRPCDPNLKCDGEEGMAALHYAAYNGHVQSVQLLLEAGADKDQPTTEAGWSPLHLATGDGHLEVVRVLVQAGADTNQGDEEEGETPLHLAARQGHLQICQFLVAAGVDKNQVTRETALHLAARERRVEIVRWLIKIGASVQNPPDPPDSEAPLHAAAEGGDVEIVRLLVEAGADKDHVEGGDGRAPLHVAIRERHPEIVRFLVEAGSGEIRLEIGVYALESSYVFPEFDAGQQIYALKCEKRPSPLVKAEEVILLLVKQRSFCCLNRQAAWNPIVSHLR